MKNVLRIKYKIIFGAVFLALPLFVFAADPDIQSILLKSIEIVNLVNKLLIAVAAATFLLGIVKFMMATGNPEKIKTARNYIIYGLIGMFVLVSFWGIIALLRNTVGLETPIESLESAQSTTIFGDSIPLQ
ncbi:hypothetical protein ACFLZC_01925 [Patescibacteria group bacterium]